MKIELHNGNNIDVLKTFEDNSIDSVVTDPPYGLGKEPDVRLMLQSWLEFDYMEVSGGGFMNKKWDAFVPQPIFWKEVFRVLKPGGHCLAFYGTRTYDWGVMAMRLAGFEIRDTISYLYSRNQKLQDFVETLDIHQQDLLQQALGNDSINLWLYGSGFPKSLNIGKQVDKIRLNDFFINNPDKKQKYDDLQKHKKVLETNYNGIDAKINKDIDSDYENYDMLKLKEQIEIIEQEIKEIEYEGNEREKTGILKKHAQKGVAIAEERGAIGGGAFGQSKIEEITKGNSEFEGWGTALKPAVEPIVLARKPISEKNIAENVLKWHTGGINIDGCRVPTDEKWTTSGNIPSNSGMWVGKKRIDQQSSSLGRFPANLILDGSEEVVAGFPNTTSQGHWSKSKITGFGDFGGGTYEYNGVGEKDNNGGSASRFFYTAKAHSSERNYGLEGFEEKGIDINSPHNSKDLEERYGMTAKNHHPTVKPLDLMQYLVRLVTPKGGICLDPFMGSGTTGMACKLEHFDFIGIELEKEYFDIAKARIDAVGEVTEVKLDNGRLF